MLSTILRVELIILAVVFIAIVIHKVNNRKLLMQYSLIWLFISLVMIVVAAFPQIVVTITQASGIETPSNLVYLIGIVGLMFISINLTAKISRQANDIRLLVQMNAIDTYLREKESRTDIND